MRKLFTSAVFVSIMVPISAAAGPPGELNRIVYWGNPTTGASVRVVNEADAEKKAEKLVKQRGGSGWVLLENSAKVGFGAAICRRQGSIIQFYTAHGYTTGKEAVTAAKAKANGGGSFCSNALWRVTEVPRKTESGGVGTLKQWVYDFLVTEKRSVSEYQRDCVAPKGSLDSTGLNWKPASWCPKEAKPESSSLRG